MPLDYKAERIEKPNLLLIAGNGRNVGKTFLVCEIIKQISKSSEVIGVKISSHFHPVEKKNVLCETNEFTIVEENEISEKDSSLMLQAGAVNVYFLMASQKNLRKAFLWLNKNLLSGAIVCESGGLAELVNPGLFLFVKSSGDEIVKDNQMQFSPVIVENDGECFNFNIQNIIYDNNRFSIKQ